MLTLKIIVPVLLILRLAARVQIQAHGTRAFDV